MPAALSLVSITPKIPPKTLCSDEPVIAFRKDYLKAVNGDVVVALVLSQIVYWYQKGTDGRPKVTHLFDQKYWIYHSYGDWAEELGISLKQARRAIEVLKELQVIETTVGPRGKGVVLYLRLLAANGKQVVNGYPKYGSAPQGLTLAPTGTPPAPKGTYIETIKETKEKTKKTTAPKTGANPTPPVDSQGYEETQPQKLKEVQHMKAHEILEKLKSKEETLITGGKVTPSALAMLWKKLEKERSQGYVKPLLPKEVGVLKWFLRDLGPELAVKTLEGVIPNWQDFGKLAAKNAGLKGYPDVPSVEFLQKHNQSAVQLIAQAEELEQKKQQQKQTVTKKPVVSSTMPVTQSEAPTLDQQQAEYEQWLKDMGQ